VGLETSKNIEVYGRTPSDRLDGWVADRVCVEALRRGSRVARTLRFPSVLLHPPPLASEISELRRDVPPKRRSRGGGQPLGHLSTL